MLNANKTVGEIINENKGKEIHLIDGAGIWGELPLSETNMQHIPDRIDVIGNVINMYVE